MEICEQLKKRRKDLGLSLAQVAERSGTSISTLSRYENGWQRFEIYTLKKLATALNCQLHIELKPEETQSNTTSPAPTPAKVVRRLKRLFWDKPLNAADLKSHPVWIVSRVIEMGQMEDVHLLMNFMGRDTFLKTVANVRFSSIRTQTFWKNILDREGIPCTKKSSPREAGSY